MPIRVYLAAACTLGLLARGELASAQQGDVRAEIGSVAIGGAVRNSTINIGISPDVLAGIVRQNNELSEAQKKLITGLEGQLDLDQRQVRAALSIVGEVNVPPEQLAAKLVEIAERLKALQANAAPQPGDDAAITALRAEVQQAIDAPDLPKADALLGQIETAQRTALDRLAANAAATAARRGDVAMARLHYREAAGHFADAASTLPKDEAHQEAMLSYLDREEDAYFCQGDEFGDNAALASAVDRAEALLTLRPRSRLPAAWAATENNLGNALQILGERETGTTKFEAAVTAYTEALKERTHDRSALDWALTEENLANTLEALGERENSVARLESALKSYDAVLKEHTRDHAPLAWAETQHNRGMTLEALGERETGAARLEAAIAAFNEALKERTRDRVPLDWAATEDSLGSALEALGEREAGMARLQTAVAAYTEALKERTRARVPLEWAATENNLGMTLAVIGERETGTASLEASISAYDAALQEYTQARVPLDWASATGYQGCALMLLAERRSDPAMAQRAADQIGAANEAEQNGDYADDADYFKTRLPKAKELASRLSKR